MSIASISFKVVSTLHDKKRDKDLEPDPDIKAHYDIRYGKSKKYNSLDVYYPNGTEEKYPTQLEELNQVMDWVMKNQEDYYIDVSNLFIVGDSAGARLALQYQRLIRTLTMPSCFLLNCGMYNIDEKMASFNKEDKKDAELKLIVLPKDYLGKDWKQYKKQLAVKDHITNCSFHQYS